MRTRLAVCTLVLLAAIPSFAARRRAASPGAPARCTFTTSPLAVEVLPDAIAIDEQYAYWIDTYEGRVYRAPFSGGETQVLADLGGEWLVLSMTVDATNIYVGVLPLTIILAPAPGEILTLPKSGGTATTLVAGVSAPWNIEADATHVYWVATGTINFANETIAPDGKVERVRKDGSDRQALAENLSAPLDLALDGAFVYYGETGLADGDPTMGVYRVGKTGGAVTTLNSDTVAAELALSNDAVIFWGGNEHFENALFRVDKDGTGFRVLVDDPFLGGPLRVIGSRVYYISSNEESDHILSTDINNPGTPVTVVSSYFNAYDFEVDACGVTYSDSTGELRRVPR